MAASSIECGRRALRRAPALLRYAARSLWQHRLRAVLSTLGVICGVVSFLVMIGIGEGAKRETLKQIEQLGIKNILVKRSTLSPEQSHHARSMGSSGLSLADGERLMQGVSAALQVAAVKEIKATTLASTREFSPQVLAVTPNFTRLQGLAIEAGRFLSDEDVRQKNLVCLLGAQVAANLGATGKPGDSLRLQNSICTIVGVLQRFERKSSKNAAISLRDFDNSIMLPLGVEVDSGDKSIDGVSELVAELRTPDDVLASLPLVKRVMAVAHRGADDYLVVAPQELLKQASQTQRTFNFVLGSIAGISLLVGGIGIMNIMLASVTERTREIGIRRALGATREHIVAQFLTEAMVLTSVGGLLGLMLGLIGSWVVSELAGWPVVVTVWAIVLPLSMSVLMGLFFGLYPAITAAQMDPIEALRHE